MMLNLQLLRLRRPFVAYITDGLGKELFRVSTSKVLRTFLSTIYFFVAAAACLLVCTTYIRFGGPFGGSLAQFMQR